MESIRLQRISLAHEVRIQAVHEPDAVHEISIFSVGAALARDADAAVYLYIRGVAFAAKAGSHGFE